LGSEPGIGQAVLVHETSDVHRRCAPAMCKRLLKVLVRNILGAVA
jgi:hypothetical protein